MRNYLNKLPQGVQDLIRLAEEIASCNNMSVYLVGGFVRDLLLGVKNLDLDIAVEDDGIKFAEDLSLPLKAKLIRHKRFGTATIILGHHQKIDVASVRREFYPEPAHLPVVKAGTLKDDLFRRDFTINAMAISISHDNFGKLIDFFSGKADLQSKKIRVLHNLSFIDDPTRILRAIRFEKRYNFKIEPGTLKLLKEAVNLKMLERVEPQRIRDDLILILKEKQPLKEIKRLQRLTGFSFISPRISVPRETCQLMHSIEKQINWFMGEHSKRRALDAWLIYFMALLDCLSRKRIKSICKRFALRKGEEKRFLEYKKINHRFISSLGKKNIRPSGVFTLLEPLSYEVILLLKAKYKNRKIQKHIIDFFQNYNDMRIHISGHDLHRLGLAPGPRYQKILSRVLKEKVDGIVTTKEEELCLIRKVLGFK